MTDPVVDELSPMKRAIVEIRELRARLADSEARAREPIAIVGMGLRFPGGASDPASFWRLLADGVDAIGEVPADRWDADALYADDPDTPGRMTTRWGGFLDGIDRFDAEFFGISPREADSMDPQQRLLLEVTWEALEQAGIPPDGLFGAPVGIFVGIGNSDYMRLLLADREQIDTYTTTGNALSIAAGRLAYVLGTRGPAIAVDTACSSSLVALHTAVRSLRAGECDVALSGGVNVILTPDLTINFSRARMMAADGRCKAFDATADGYVRSEGCAVVVLKRLRDAQAAGDEVLAVVRGSAVNQDGRSGGLTAPNGPAQEEVVRAALADAGATAADVAYVEAHGTGTLLGDPIEIGALDAAIASGRDASDPLLVGSVKTNIGHTETAAGIAGVVKSVLVLRHATVPPHLHLSELNPHVAAVTSAVAVPTHLTALPGVPGRRVVGVSSFGLSGTNAHVVIGEAPPVPAATDPSPRSGVAVLPLSARSDEALDALADRYADLLAADDVSLAAVTHAAGTMRSHLSHRLGVVATDRDSTIAALRAAGRQPAAPPGTARSVRGRTAGTVAWLFTGHGSHHRGAGRRLYAAEPVFRAAIDRCAALVGEHLDVPLTEVLFGDGDLLDDMVYAQPALFALQYALAETWSSWGVRPDVVAGHSAGEYVAAVVAGVLSLADGLRLIAERGRLLASVSGDGRMVALFTAEAAVAAAVAGRRDEVDIAAVNGPFTTVVSGRPAAVAAVIADLELDDDDVRPLDISVAAHSPLVEPVLDDLVAALDGVALAPPTVGLVSSMTGRFADAELTDPAYWRRHLRAAVRFADVFTTLRAAGCRTFIEIGPQPTLLNLGRRNWPDADATWVASMRHETDEVEELSAGLAAVYAAGVDVDWAATAPVDGVPRRVPLPTYPWQRHRHWSSAARTPGSSSVRPRFDSAVAAAAQQAGQGPLDLDAGSYPARWALADAAATAAMTRTLGELGLFAAAGDSHTVAEIVARGTVGDAYGQLVGRWLDHLVADGLLEREGDRVVARRTLPDADVDGRLAALAAACAGIEPFAEYVARCCSQLTAVLSGRESALNTLFPDGSYATVDFNYGTWAVPRYFNAVVRAAVEGALAARPGTALRILEIGAGTGGTTAAVLPVLPASRVAYTFSDVSPFFLDRAAERFAAHPFVRYARLDIEKPPAGQGEPDGEYDVVIAANVLHATRDLDRTLGHVHRLLAPGGVLVAIESTTHPRFFDITTGLIEGWQRFDDAWRTDVPLIGVTAWRAALEAAGFASVAVEPQPASPAARLLQHVVLARAAGDDVEDRPLPEQAAVADTGPLPIVTDIDLDGVALLAAALPGERHDVLVGLVRDAVGHVLRSHDRSRLGRNEPLLDLGFDSLMAVELRNVLRSALALERKLPATLVFDHPTIGAIATHLDTLLAGPPEPSAPAGPSDLGAGDGLDVDAVASLSDDEAEAMLLARLTELEP